MLHDIMSITYSMFHHFLLCWQVCRSIGHATLVVITGTTILVPYHKVKSQQFIWRLRTVYFIHSSKDCKEWTTWECTRIIAPPMTASDMPHCNLIANTPTIFFVKPLASRAHTYTSFSNSFTPAQLDLWPIQSKQPPMSTSILGISYHHYD